MRCICRVGEFWRFGRVSSTRAGWSCAARARLEGGGGRKRAGARLHAQTHSAGGCAGARYAVARLGAVIILRQNLKKMAFRRKKYKKTPPEELRRARARLYTDGRAFFACHGRAWARTLRASWQPAQKKPPRKPPQNLRRRRSLCRLPSASAAGRLATVATAPRARQKPVGATKMRLVITEADHARAARARRRTASKSIWQSRRRNAASSTPPPKRRVLNLQIFCEILSIPFKILLNFIIIYLPLEFAAFFVL